MDGKKKVKGKFTCWNGCGRGVNKPREICPKCKKRNGRLGKTATPTKYRRNPNRKPLSN